MPNFSKDIEEILEKIRLNCGILHEYNRKRFIEYNQQIKWYRIPVLILSSTASVWSVSGTTFLQQSQVSLINMMMGLFAGLITSIELFVKLDEKMKNAEDLGHKYYSLSIDIYRTLLLDDMNRTQEGKEYLNEAFGQYLKLNENGFLLDKRIKDQLLVLPEKLKLTLPSPMSLNTLNTETDSNSSKDLGNLNNL